MSDTIEISRENAERILGWQAYGLRQAFSQYEVPIHSRHGVADRDFDMPGTWVETEGAALVELHRALGGFKVDQYVLAMRPGEGVRRRYRIKSIDGDRAVATEAWSLASEKTEHVIELGTAIYIG